MIEPIEDFAAYDAQVYTSTQRSGDWCPKMIEEATNYVTKQGLDRDTPDDFIQRQLESKGIHNMDTNDWLRYFADISASAV